MALFRGRDNVNEVLAEMNVLGMDLNEVLLLHSTEGIARFDFDGSRHGWWPHPRRTLKSIGGADANISTIYLEGLTHGPFLVFVPLHTRHPHDEVVDVLRCHDAHAITYFTPGSMESVPTLNA